MAPMNNSLLLSTSLLVAQLLYNSAAKKLQLSLVTPTLISIGIVNLLFKNIEIKYRDGRKYPILYSVVFGFVDSVLLMLGLNLLYRASLLFNILYSFLMVNILFVRIKKPFFIWSVFVLSIIVGMTSVLFDIDRDSSKLFFSIDQESINPYNFVKDQISSLYPFTIAFLILRRIATAVSKYRALAEIYIRPDCLRYENEEEKKLIVPQSLENFEFYPITPYFIGRYYSIGYFMSGILYLLTENIFLVLSNYKLYLYIVCVVICTIGVRIYQYNKFLSLYTVQITLLLFILSILIPRKIGVEIFKLSTFELFTGKLYIFILGIFITNLVVYYFRKGINKLIVNTFL